MPRTHEENKEFVAFRFHPALVRTLRAAAENSADTLTGYVEEAVRQRLKREGHLPRKMTKRSD